MSSNHYCAVARIAMSNPLDKLIMLYMSDGCYGHNGVFSFREYDHEFCVFCGCTYEEIKWRVEQLDRCGMIEIIRDRNEINKKTSGDKDILFAVQILHGNDQNYEPDMF